MDAHELYVVGIGASAGGLEALERFFTNVPGDSGLAFVVVQHLSPDFKSLMHELLARRTTIPIQLVEDGMRVEPDNIYLIPAKKEMIIAGGRLLLSDKEAHQELSLPIDTFLRSLAQDRGPHAIAVVLSGGGSDGSRGVRDVHDAGGLVIVQDETAKFDGMPKSARDTGIADWALPPEDMPSVVLEHVRGGGPGAISKEAPSPELAEARGLAAVYRLLEDAFGIDFSHYKPSTVTRRIERRVRLARTGDLSDYIERLKSTAPELDALYRDLLIGVTRFFRDRQAFELLEQQILPELLQRGSRDEEFRVWISGCATGEEAYSLAILLHELLPRFGERRVKIFATDVHRGSLEIAARAIYDEETLEGVTPERLERYFTKRGRSFQVAPELRQMIVFAPHNVIKDAPFTRVDLVSCRNLLIYLQPLAQRKVLSLFHFALKRGGVLMLGPSESPGALADDFETIDAHWRVYRKYRDVRLTLDSRVHPPVRPKPRGVGDLHGPLARHSPSQVMSTYDALLEEFMPPSLLVNAERELIHAFGGASRFLKVKDGRPTLDLLDMVDLDLKMALTGGLGRALKEQAPVVYTGLRLELDGKEQLFKLTVRPVRSKSSGITHLLISFEGIAGSARPAAAPETELLLDQVSREQLGALEAELRYTKENLQATIEELETSNEELQATNEELLASNEELQSTNEELQSVNEELYTVNAEYQRKITQLTELTNDMDNLLSSTDVGTIFLDRELRVRKFTPRVAETFSLLAHDIGRTIDSFTHNIDHPGLADDLASVLASGSAVEREVRDRRGSWLFLRVLPYRAKSAIEGVVLTLIDISSLKAAEDALFHERHLLRSLLSTIPDAIYFKDAQGKFIRMNQPMAERLGIDDASRAVGKNVFELLERDTALALQQDDESVLRTGEAQRYRLERRSTPDGERWHVVTRLPLSDRSGRIVGTIAVFRDVTEQKLAEEKIHEAVRRRDQFLAMLSHELRNPLGAIVNASVLLDRINGDAQKQKKALGVIERQSRQMARLLDDLLEVSRVTQNKIELKKRVLDLRDVATEAADAVRDLMDSRGIRFEVEIDSRPLPVEGDAARLQQIQVNLLSNAAKYTQRGGQVRLEALRENNHALVRVSDTGVGIRADMLDSVFDLFVQSSATLDRADGGMGVGLTLVRSLVAMHGGSVSAHSPGEGRGSQFTVRLPITSAESEELPRPRQQVEWPAGTRILVVEDNPDSRNTLCSLLELAGFECFSAESGQDGLELLERERPQIGIIDIGLPGIDGFELARRIRTRPEHSELYLVALTGYGQPTDRAQALAAGYDEHLVKPLNPEDLMRLLVRSSPELERAADGGGRNLPSG